MEIQEDSQEQESKNKDKGILWLFKVLIEFKLYFIIYIFLFFTETILPLSYAAKVSISMAILMYLKEHLKKAYALSEA